MLSHSRVWLFATSRTVAHQAPLSMGFSRQEYWSGLPCPPPVDLPNLGIQSVSPVSLTLAGGVFFFTTSTTCIFLSSLSLLEDSTKTFSFWKIKITKWNVIYICVTYRYLKASNRHLPKHIQKRINIYWKDICKTTEMKGRYKYTDLKWSRTPWSSPHQPCPQSVFCLWKKFSQRISEKM